MKKMTIVMVMILLLALPTAVLADVSGHQFGDQECSEQLKTMEELRQRSRECYNEQEWGEMERLMQEVRNRYRTLEPIDPTKIVCQNRVFKFDVPPVIKEGRSLFPIRTLVEEFGATVDWNQEERTVTIEIDGKVIVLDMDEKEATVDGEVIELDTKPEIVFGRSVVPLRFILESLGFEVQYDANTGTIEIIE